MIDTPKLTDDLAVAVGSHRRPVDGERVVGSVEWALLDRDGQVKESGVVDNIITELGDQYYGERAAGIATPPGQVTGMQLGTGTTAPSKTGAGAAIVTYVAGSDKAIDGGFPTSALEAGKRRIQWKTTWAAGEATANDIAEVAIVNRTLDGSVATAAQTISRALISPTVNKAADDTLAVTWNHDIGTP